MCFWFYLLNLFLKCIFIFYFWAALCSMWGFRAQIRDWTHILGIEPISSGLEAWSLNHWTTREVVTSTIFSNPHLPLLRRWLLPCFRPSPSHPRTCVCSFPVWPLLWQIHPQKTSHPTSLKVALPDASLPGGYSPGVTHRALLPTNLLALFILDLPTRPSHFYLFVHIPSSLPLCAIFQVVSSFTIPSPTI